MILKALKMYRKVARIKVSSGNTYGVILWDNWSSAFIADTKWVGRLATARLIWEIIWKIMALLNKWHRIIETILNKKYSNWMKNRIHWFEKISGNHRVIEKSLKIGNFWENSKLKEKFVKTKEQQQITILKVNKVFTRKKSFRLRYLKKYPWNGKPNEVTPGTIIYVALWEMSSNAYTAIISFNTKPVNPRPIWPGI